MASKIDFFGDLYDEGTEDEQEQTQSRKSKLRQRDSKLIRKNSGRASRQARFVGEMSQAINFEAQSPHSDASEVINKNQDNPDCINDLTNTESSLLNSTTINKTSNDAGAGVSNTGSLQSRPKRKRDHYLKFVPEEQQILRGKNLFFLPDDDIAEGRRFRIQRAQEYGATWVKNWSPGVTHLVVDKGISFEAIIKYLRLQYLPKGLTVVNELWPGHCILYGHLVNHNQPQYVVPGSEAIHMQLPASSSSLTVFANSDKPLVVKPDTRSSLQTPPQTDRSNESNASRKPTELSKDTWVRPSVRVSNEVDALDDAITKAQGLKDVILEESDPDMVELNNDEASDDDESSKAVKRRKFTDGSKGNDWQHNFHCMHKHDGSTKLANPNTETIEILLKMYDYYEQTQDQWRCIAYRKAITALKQQTKKILNKEDAMSIPFIGERLADKIEEIVWTGRLRRLEGTSLEPNDKALKAFLKIYGVGYKQAAVFIAQGFRTLDDLKAHAKLTKNQRIGIEHYDDFQTRISRDEVSRHGSYVQKELERLDPNIEVQLGGSYRRGAETSGDVDFIITARDTPIDVLRTQILEELIPRLFACNYLKCSLATTSSGTGTKWHGAACLPGSSPSIWRRVDFLLVPYNEYGAALIYFTGNDIFNRSIRLLASRKGMRLNQRGLWKDVVRGKDRERITQGTLVESRSEKAIFKALGVPWRPPEHRNC